MEWTMWSIAPVSKTQVSFPKAVLLTGLTANIECCILRHVESKNGSQDCKLLKRALGFTIKLAEWITSLVPDTEAWLDF